MNSEATESDRGLSQRVSAAEVAFRYFGVVERRAPRLRRRCSREFQPGDDSVRAGPLHEYGAAFEVQMLMGVREDVQRRLGDGEEVYQYVLYGSKWFSYFHRRVRKRKENAPFAIRAVLSQSLGSSSFDSALRRCSSIVVFEMSSSAASSRVDTPRGHW